MTNPQYRRQFEEKWILQIKEEKMTCDLETVQSKKKEIDEIKKILHQLNSDYLKLIGQENQIKNDQKLQITSKKSENLLKWYSEIVTQSEIIDNYGVLGFYTMRAYGYSIWQIIKDQLTKDLQKLNVEEFYSPLLTSQQALEQHKGHFKQFQEQIAYITRYYHSEFAVPIGLRPTSESVIYPVLGKWIQSYQHLPLKLYEFNNVIRYNCKNPLPFLRMKEVLWQEGHNAYATKEEAQKDQKLILDFYSQICKDYLALPVIKGYRTEKGKFAGAVDSLSLHTFIGRVIQVASSHYYGQNFSKIFKVVFQDPLTHKMRFVEQNAYSFSTRVMGAMILEHGDDRGVVVPPAVAPIQIVLLSEDLKRLENTLKDNGIRVHLDSRPGYNKEWKQRYWELKVLHFLIIHNLVPYELKKQPLAGADFFLKSWLCWQHCTR